MMMQSFCNRVVVFDLDDTLYKEEDFLFSGFQSVARRVADKSLFVNEDFLFVQMKQWRLDGKDVFEELCRLYPDYLTKEACLGIYRYHIPSIALTDGASELLEALKTGGARIGLITDGRTRTQMNKIRALKLHKFIASDDIVISEEFGSEKPSEANSRYFMEKYPNAKYVYVGDNVKKDFVTPNYLGWLTICLLDDGRNIHRQSFDVAKEFLPQVTITNIKELLDYCGI